MSADVLRRAAALMWERALGAQEQGDAAWAAMPTIDPDNDGWVVALDLPDADWDTTIARTPYDYEGNEVTPHIASWHPAVALAVADWLEAEASAMDSMDKFNGITSDLVREEKFNIRGAAMAVSLGENGSIGIRADTSTPALAVAVAYLNEQVTA